MRKLIMNNRARFKRSFKIIEILITYVCNRSCLNCQAMVRQAPSAESMSLEQIKKFVFESINNKIRWEWIRLIGGEPTLHKEIYEIVKILIDYKLNYSPQTKITLVTNGYKNQVNTVIEKLTNKFEIEIENTHKVSDKQIHFSPINQAPIDMVNLKFSDLSKGCYITSTCGIALDIHGYYPCAASAAIDRVFGFDLGRKKQPTKNDLMDDLLLQFCKLCGFYYHKMNYLVNFDINCDEDYNKLKTIVKRHWERLSNEIKTYEQIISPTWEMALKNWNKCKPKLTKY